MIIPILIVWLLTTKNEHLIQCLSVIYYRIFKSNQQEFGARYQANESMKRLFQTIKAKHTGRLHWAKVKIKEGTDYKKDNSYLRW